MQEYKFQSGALVDVRSEAAKTKDHRFEEVVASIAPVNWVKKTPEQIRKFPIFNQNGSGSCVAQTGRKMLGVYSWLKTDVFLKLSAAHIYKRRSNKPQAGMGGDDVFKIMQQGTTLELFAPDDQLTDEQMDSANVNEFEEGIGKCFSIGNYLTVTPGDIETVASIIQQTGKAVMVWFYFTGDEWTARPSVKNPNLDRYALATGRHSVAAVDFTLTDDGKKALIIDDSWGPTAGNGAGQRTVDEDFYKSRNFYVGHFMNYKFEDQTQPGPTPAPKPKYTFTKVLLFGMTDPDVKALQDILRYEGLFPVNTDSSAYYGAITATGVLAWQKKHNVAPAEELDPLAGRRVGQKTITSLNQLYG